MRARLLTLVAWCLCHGDAMRLTCTPRPYCAACTLPHPRVELARCIADDVQSDEDTELTVQLSTPKCDFPGCDGNGRAMGGLAAIPLFEWWPIKAYRPCPKCAERGVRYSRSGQTLDEVCYEVHSKLILLPSAGASLSCPRPPTHAHSHPRVTTGR